MIDTTVSEIKDLLMRSVDEHALKEEESKKILQKIEEEKKELFLLRQEIVV